MSQHPVKKKHRHKKHKSQDTERNKDSEAVGQGLRQLEPEKPASSSAGTLQKNGEAYILKGRGSLTTALKQAIASAWTKYILHVCVKINLQNFTNRMALMHDYVRRGNFTTKPLLPGKFSAFALFVVDILFKFAASGILLCKTQQLYNFKMRLGGEICSFDIFIQYRRGLISGGEGLPVSNLSVSKNQIGLVILSDLNSDTVLSLD